MMMKVDFLEWFEGAVEGRWPRCSFTSAQISDWYWRLRGFSTEMLDEAVRRHAVCDEPRRPSLKAVHAKARQLNPPDGGGQESSSGVPDANTYIQCVGRDATGGGQVGMFVPILLWPFGDHHSTEAIEKTAWHQASLHQRTYGGIWEPVYGTSQFEMLQRRGRLQRDNRILPQRSQS